MAAPPKSDSLVPAGPARKAELARVEPTLYLPKVEPGRLLGILQRRGWLMLAGAGLAIAGVWIYLQTAPKFYESVGSVEVSSQAPDVLNIQGLPPEDSRDLEQLRTIERNMASSALLLRVVRANGLTAAADFAPAGSTEQEAVALLAKRTRVELDRGTRVVVIRVEDTDPARAKSLVESLVAGYDHWIKERREGLARQAGEGLAREEARLRVEKEQAAARLQEFRAAHPVLDLGGEDRADGDSLGVMEAELTRSKSERLRLEAEYESFKKFNPADPGAISTIHGGTHAEQVLAQVGSLQAKELEFSKVKERYLHKHPVYKEIAREVESLKADLAETVRASGQALEKSYHVALENEAKLQAEVDDARRLLVGVEGLRARFQALVREADTARELHEKVDVRLRESALAGAVAASALAWAEPPLIPEKAVRPSKKVLLPLAGLAGMMAGMLMMVSLEAGDRRVFDSAAAARAIGAPLLAKLPEFEPGRERDMVLVSAPDSPSAEAFRRLRALLLPPASKPGARTILFASAMPGEGRSLCALNYAASLALQGQRTLLLDADLRRPGLSRQHLKGEFRGLGDYLAGDPDSSKACFPTALPNLFLLSSGQLRNDAAELLSGTRFPVLLEDAHRWFDAIVIDSPPVLSVSDALAIARYVDGTCLVVRRDASDRRQLQKAAELIRSAGGNLVGFVWNELPVGAKPAAAPEPVVPVSHPALDGSSDEAGPSAASVAGGDGPRIDPTIT